MLLAEYVVVRSHDKITGLVVRGCIPLREDFDEIVVELFNCYGSRTLMVTFNSSGSEFDTVSFADLTDELVGVLEQGLLIQDVETEVELYCRAEQQLCVPA